MAFGIRTHLTPLTDLDDDTADHLAARLRAFPAEVAEYKSITGVRDELLATLRSDRVVDNFQD